MPPLLPRITALRYVTPLREGGSLPAVMEADDDGTYVVKFRGAGQGLKVLVAEVITSEIARILGIPTPELAVITLEDAMTRYERDEEVQDLLKASVGTNLASDFLPGSFGYDGSSPPTADLAARIVWLDAYTLNIDRTWANPNLIVWHGQVHAIDHGASLWFHHSWPSKTPNPTSFAARGLDPTKHVLADVAGSVAEVSESLVSRLSDEILAKVLDRVPDEWLEPMVLTDEPEQIRRFYLEHLVARRDSAREWTKALT